MTRPAGHLIAPVSLQRVLDDVEALAGAVGNMSGAEAVQRIRLALDLPGVRCADHVCLSLPDIAHGVMFRCDLEAGHVGPHGQTLSSGPGSASGAHARLGWSWSSVVDDDGVAEIVDDDPESAPEWEYAVREVGRKHGSPGPPEGPGWVRDPDRGRPGEGFERFDAHDEYYWRRPLLCGACNHPNAAHDLEMPMGNDDGSAGRRWWQCTAGGAIGRLCSCAQPVTGEQMEARR